MEKLIELLNEAQKDVGLFWHCLGNCERKLYAKGHWELTKELDDDYDTYYYSDEDICSKRCGFIKWLVDNKKIRTMPTLLNLFIPADNISLVDKHIMMLSIKDNPIDYLIQLLK